MTATLACDNAMNGVGSGVAAALRGVDCMAGEMTEAAFGRLFGAGGALGPALTILLTLFIGLFAFALLTGRSRIGIASLTPRMMTLGLVLTFATSWVAYQSVVWNLAVGAPDQIAGIMTGLKGSATTVFANKIDIVFGVIGQIAEQKQGQEAVSAFSPSGLLWMGATLLLLGTVGVLLTAKIALAVLVAIGPVFVVMALFKGTRGLFVGWLKGLVMLAIAPLFAVLGGGLMLEIAVPVIAGLASSPGQIDPRAAMAFFLIGAVHVALMMLIFKTAATMVAGWRVFGLVDEGAERSGVSTAASAAQLGTSMPAPQASVLAAQAASTAPARHITLASAQVAQAANDHDPHHSGSGASDSRARGVAAPARAELSKSTVSRTRGIGSRFRAAPARSTEKLK